MLLILGDQLILHSVMKDSLLMVKHPEFHYGSRYSGVAAKVPLRQYSGCKSLKLSYPEDTQWCCLFWEFDLNICCCRFVKAHSILSKCWTECSLFLKPVHPLGKKTTPYNVTFSLHVFFFDGVSWKITSIILFPPKKKKYMWLTPIWPSQAEKLYFKHLCGPKKMQSCH